MTGRAERPPKTLVVAPLGARPWVPAQELIGQLSRLGHDVVLNSAVSGPVVSPEPLPSRVGAWANFLPRVLWWLGRMLWRWRAGARRALRDGGFSSVLVWDPILMLLYRVARPAGVELVWVLPRPEGHRLYQRVLRALSLLAVDRVIVSTIGESELAVGRETIVAPAATASSFGLLDEWVLLASDRLPTRATLAGLERLAADRPCDAVVFDARDDDHLGPEAVEAVRRAARAPRVWRSGDEEWIAWSGGVARTSVDPSDGFAADHRHYRVAASGGRLLVPAHPEVDLGERWAPADSSPDGWRAFTSRPGVTGVAESEWAAAAFPPHPPSRAELVARHAMRAGSCPMCSGIARSVLCESEGGTFIVRCARCQLVRASHVAPAGTFDPGLLCEPSGGSTVPAARVLDALDLLGVVPGRVLQLGADLEPLDEGATARGWETVRVEVVGTLQELAGVGRAVGRSDVVVVGLALPAAADPVGMLRLLAADFLNPGGHVLIEVPNARSLGRHLQRGRWNRWHEGEHHTYPDEWTIRQMLCRGGLRARRVSTETHGADVDELTLAQSLGLVSAALARRRPELQKVLGTRAPGALLRVVARAADERGWGENLLAVGQLR